MKKGPRFKSRLSDTDAVIREMCVRLRSRLPGIDVSLHAEDERIVVDGRAFDCRREGFRQLIELHGMGAVMDFIVKETKKDEPDLLDRLIADREAKKPGFVEKVDAAYRRRGEE